MQYNEARKGKKPCEDTGKLGFGIYLCDVLNKNVLTKIGRNSTEGSFLKDSGSMCRGVVRGKIRGTKDDDGAAKHTQKGTEFLDFGDKQTKT